MPNDQLIRISRDAWKVLQHTKAERRGTLGQLASTAIVQQYGEMTVRIPARLTIGPMPTNPLRRKKVRLPIKRKKSK